MLIISGSVTGIQDLTQRLVRTIGSIWYKGIQELVPQ